MKVLSATAVILALAALGAALFVGYRLERRGESQAEPVSKVDVTALSADLAALKGQLAAVEERLGAMKAPPEPGDVPSASIVPLLKHLDPNVRRSAVEILKGLKDAGAVPALRQTAVNDVDPLVRSAAFRAISGLGGEEARRFLLEAVKSTDSEVSRQAVEHLGQVGKAEDFDVVAAVFDREIAGVRPEAGRESYLPPSVRSPLKVMVDLAPARSLSRVIKAINLCPNDYNTRAYLSTAVTADNVMELIRAVQEVPVSGGGAGGTAYSASRNSLHHAALMAVRKTKDKRALPYVVKLLESDDTALRATAAMSIGEIGGPEACEPLEKALNKALEEAEKQPSFGSGSALSLLDALRSTKDGRACAPMVKALSSRHSQLACYAAGGLISCVDPAQGEAIFKIWKETADARLKSALGNALRFKREYGYVWDEADKTFKKAAADEDKGIF